MTKNGEIEYLNIIIKQYAQYPMNEWLNQSQPSKPIYLSIYLFKYVFLYLNDPEEDSSKTKRNNQAPGNDISDIEHLLDDQPISELHNCACHRSSYSV